MQTKLLINGTLTPGGGSVERVLDPATGKCIAEVPEASPQQVGAQGESGVEMGPLISAEQRTRVAGFVERAAVGRDRAARGFRTAGVRDPL
jgi:acyl-CoA reductase-like NAD-dependent aldehyde dehydrogenase